METNDTPAKPLDYRSILEAMEAQRAALDRAITEMRVLAGVSGPQGGGEANSFNAGSSVLSAGDVPAGVFHGKSIPDAAIFYLKLTKQKQKTADIGTALKKGGIYSKAKPEKFNGQLHSQLDRASQKENAELVKLDGAYWALREWFPANVRAGMTSGAAPTNKKKKKTGKKRSGTSQAAKPTKTPSQPAAIPAAPAPAPYRAPEKSTTEGRILGAMYLNPTREWTPAEVAAAASIPRVQTVHFLLGKMAYRHLVSKTDAGNYTVKIPVQ